MRGREIAASIVEIVARLAAVGLGGWLAYTEITGTYEYYLAEQGSLNYVVKAACGVVAASVILPHFLSRAIREGRLLRAFNLVLGLVLAIAVVFTAAIHRTGSTADNAHAERVEAKRKSDAAAANMKDAEEALKGDRLATAAECKTGVGPNCKGLRAATKEILKQATDARTAYANGDVEKPDPLASRLVAVTQGTVTETQVRLYHPFLVPVAVSFLAGLLITIGLEVEKPMPTHRTASGLFARIGGRLRRKPRAVQPPTALVDGAGIEPTEALATRVSESLPALCPELIAPLQASQILAPTRPKPRLVSDLPPTLSVHDFAMSEDGLRRSAEARIEFDDFYLAYFDRCRREGKRALTPDECTQPLKRLCRDCSIPIVSENGKVYLVGVTLAPAVPRLTAI